jgi:hypothetical protein
VDGYGSFDIPLRSLKECGDIAARAFLLLSLGVKLPRVTGVWPRDGFYGPFRHTRAEKVGRVQFTYWSSEGANLAKGFVEAVTGESSAEAQAKVWRAIESLIANGFFYPVSLVLSRSPEEVELSDGTPTNIPPDDAELLYALETLTHGPPPTGEEGLAQLISQTARELGHPLLNGATGADGFGAEDYVAIAPAGQEVMVCGVLRPRFRAGDTGYYEIGEAWNQLATGTARFRDLVTSIRIDHRLPRITQDDGERPGDRSAQQLDKPAARPIAPRTDKPTSMRSLKTQLYVEQSDMDRNQKLKEVAKVLGLPQRAGESERNWLDRVNQANEKRIAGMDADECFSRQVPIAAEDDCAEDGSEIPF